MFVLVFTGWGDLDGLNLLQCLNSLALDMLESSEESHILSLGVIEMIQPTTVLGRRYV